MGSLVVQVCHSPQPPPGHGSHPEHSPRGTASRSSRGSPRRSARSPAAPPGAPNRAPSVAECANCAIECANSAAECANCAAECAEDHRGGQRAPPGAREPSTIRRRVCELCRRVCEVCCRQSITDSTPRTLDAGSGLSHCPAKAELVLPDRGDGGTGRSGDLEHRPGTSDKACHVPGPHEMSEPRHLPDTRPGSRHLAARHRPDTRHPARHLAARLPAPHPTPGAPEHC